MIIHYTNVIGVSNVRSSITIDHQIFHSKMYTGIYYNSNQYLYSFLLYILFYVLFFFHAHWRLQYTYKIYICNYVYIFIYVYIPTKVMHLNVFRKGPLYICLYSDITAQSMFVVAMYTLARLQYQVATNL